MTESTEVRPDGKLVLMIKDPEGLHQPPSPMTFTFVEMVWWKRMPEGLMIKFDWGTTTILWHRILSYDVWSNSQEYVDWYRMQRHSSEQDVTKWPWDQQMFVRTREKKSGKVERNTDWQEHPHG